MNSENQKYLLTRRAASWSERWRRRPRSVGQGTPLSGLHPDDLGGPFDRYVHDGVAAGVGLKVKQAFHLARDHVLDQHPTVSKPHDAKLPKEIAADWALDVVIVGEPATEPDTHAFAADFDRDRFVGAVVGRLRPVQLVIGKFKERRLTAGADIALYTRYRFPESDVRWAYQTSEARRSPTRALECAGKTGPER